MVYIKLDIGSTGKGYGIASSDRDYVIFTKAPEDVFVEFIENKSVLVNKHVRENNNDYVYADLYKGLMGIYNGNYYYLIFAKQEDVVDKNGVPNTDLYEYITKLTKLRIVNVLRTMMRYQCRGLHDYPKHALALMFNCAYADHWLTKKAAPPSHKLNDLLSKNQEAMRVFRSLLSKRESDVMRASADELAYINGWRDNLMERLSRIPPLPERPDVRKSIVLYMLNMCGPVMPEDVSLVKMVYPSIQQLDRKKMGMLKNKTVHIQEKLDGCNFRVIVLDDGSITYGSRNTYRPKDDFMGFYRIKERVEACANRLKKALEREGGFIVYGELVGWRADNKKQPLNDLLYRDQNLSLEYYAYEIQLSNGQFIGFVEAQQLLIKSQFAVIPYKTQDYKSFVNDNINFESLLFPGHEPELIEGYILRHNHLRYKIKPEYNLDELKVTTTPFEHITRDYVGVFVDDSTVNFDSLLMKCFEREFNDHVPDDCTLKKFFNRLFALYCRQFNLNDHNKRYKKFVMDIKTIEN